MAKREMVFTQEQIVRMVLQEIAEHRGENEIFFNSSVVVDFYQTEDTDEMEMTICWDDEGWNSDSDGYVPAEKSVTFKMYGDV